MLSLQHEALKSGSIETDVILLIPEATGARTIPKEKKHYQLALQMGFEQPNYPQNIENTMKEWLFGILI